VNSNEENSAQDENFGPEETCGDIVGRHIKVAFCGTNPTLILFLLFVGAVLGVVGIILQTSFAGEPQGSETLTSLRVTIDGTQETSIWNVLYAVAIALAVFPFARAVNYAFLGLIRWALFSRLVSVVLYIDAFDNGPLTTVLWAVSANEIAVRLSGLPSLGALSTRLLVLFIVIGLVTGLKNLMLAILQGRAILDHFTTTVRQAVQRLVVLQNLSAAAVTVAGKRARLLAKFNAAKDPFLSSEGDNIRTMESSAVAISITDLDNLAPTLGDLAGAGSERSAPELMLLAEAEAKRSSNLHQYAPPRKAVNSSPNIRMGRAKKRFPLFCAASVASVALDSTAPGGDMTADSQEGSNFAIHSTAHDRNSETESPSQRSMGQNTSESHSTTVLGAELLTRHAVQLAVVRSDGLLSTVLQPGANDRSDDSASSLSSSLQDDTLGGPFRHPRTGLLSETRVPPSPSSSSRCAATEHHVEVSAPIRDVLDADMTTPQVTDEVNVGDLRDFEDEEDNYYVLSSYIEQGEFSLFDGKGSIVAVRNAAHAKKIVHGLFSALDVQNTGHIDREQLSWAGNGWLSPLGPGWSEDSIEGAFAEIGADNAVAFSRADLLQFTEAAVDGFRSLHLTLNSYTAVTRALNMVSNVLLGIIFLIFFVVLFSFDVQPLLISLGTLFVSLGFAISGPASNLVESLVFLLVTRPFELGDRVRFDKGDPMYVRRMDLYTTTFERLDGNIHTATLCWRHGRCGMRSAVDSLWSVQPLRYP
jgi:hypothetical protein